MAHARTDGVPERLEPAWSTRGSLFVQGSNCSRIARANRVAFLIDGEAYYGALADAVEQARHSVLLVGWDFHSKVELRRDVGSEGETELVALLEAQVKRQPDLHVNVLGWDFAMLYALERETLPSLQFGARTHRRIHFQLDAAHPVGASQHVKLAVIDDRIAFVGGFDLTSHRWDTRAHTPADPRRETPGGTPYQPFHDVQVAVDGDAAAALGELARRRWLRATGEEIPAPIAQHDPWPSGIEPDAKDVGIAISRTRPSMGDEAEIREIEALYRDSIGRAQRFIYIENQYMTSSRIADWLAARLREPQGPEVIVVGPRRGDGWLEENTMGVLRTSVIQTLREADRFDRLRLLYPHIEGLPDDQMLNVHSKLMVIDDEFVRVGSSNLSNRSLGFDSECDLSFIAGERQDLREVIARFKNDLLAEHLGTDVAQIEAALEAHGTLAATIDAFAEGERRLLPIEEPSEDDLARIVEAVGAVDPEHPVPIEELAARFEVDEETEPAAKTARLGGFVFLLVAILFVGIALETTSLSDWLSESRLSRSLGVLRDAWYGPIAALGIFIVASVCLVPVVALTVASGMALGPVVGTLVAWGGTTIAAAIGYLAGRWFWRDSVQEISGERVEALSERLGRSGVLSSALVRVFPIAPFMVVNVIAGVSHVSARDFILGTALGILPGSIFLAFAGDQTRDWLSTSSDSLALGIAVTVALIGAAFWVFKRRRARAEEKKPS